VDPIEQEIMKPAFFESAKKFRKWLEKNHETASELLVGFYKKGSGNPSITWPESVDQALCFGWIDGVRRRIDDVSYTIRFTPRRQTSIWSAINIKRATELKELGLMHAAGHAAFDRRRDDKSRIYSYENAPKTFSAADEKKFRANKKAWQFFNEQPPSYRRLATYRVMGARKEETHAARLAKLIDASARGRRL
jgi:uncharacterized protein YdeI (YjbR/CyaY-like superfamily)